MDSDAYLTIEVTAQAKMVEKKSTFLAFLHPVSSDEEAEEWLRQYRKKYYDARHVCYAYVLHEPTAAKSSDNGEPSGTAGRPMLGVLTSHGLRCVLAVVVRYFGGIKLGTSGLTAAYRESVELALAQAVVVEKQQEENWAFTFPYDSVNAVMQAVKSESGIRILQSSFDLHCQLEVAGARSQVARLKARLEKVVADV